MNHNHVISLLHKQKNFNVVETSLASCTKVKHLDFKCVKNKQIPLTTGARILSILNLERKGNVNKFVFM